MSTHTNQNPLPNPNGRYRVEKVEEVEDYITRPPDHRLVRLSVCLEVGQFEERFVVLAAISTYSTPELMDALVISLSLDCMERDDVMCRCLSTCSCSGGCGGRCGCDDACGCESECDCDGDCGGQCGQCGQCGYANTPIVDPCEEKGDPWAWDEHEDEEDEGENQRGQCGYANTPTIFDPCEGEERDDPWAWDEDEDEDEEDEDQCEQDPDYILTSPAPLPVQKASRRSIHRRKCATCGVFFQSMYRGGRALCRKHRH